MRSRAGCGGALSWAFSIRDALGSQQVQQMAASSGLPVGAFLQQMAQHLPQAASEQAGTNPG